MTDPSVPPGPPTTPPEPATTGFFGWVRSLGVIRSDGWIGGVASGVAVRIGIDPIIVRGLFVVLTLLGLPMVFLYAVAWALLPDARGSIHLQNMFRGRFDAPMIAILIITVLTVVPVVPAVLGIGLFPFAFMGDVWPYEWSNGIAWSNVFDGGTVILSIALVALIIFAIIKASQSRRERARNAQTGPYAGYTQSGFPEGPAAGSPYAGPQGPGVPFAGPGAPAAGQGSPSAGQGVPYAGQGVPYAGQATAGPGTPYAAPPAAYAGTAPTVVTEPTVADGAPVPPAEAGQTAYGATASMTPGANASLPSAAAGAPVEASPSAPSPGYDQWRQQHEAWLGSHEQWRVQQADAERVAKQRARAEAIAQGQELNRLAAEQAAVRRAANPRTSVGFVAAVVAVAVIAAAVVALLVAPQGMFLAATAALLVAGGVGGLGMALAGLLRRRSGFLTFLTISTLAVALPMGLVAAPFAQEENGRWGFPTAEDAAQVAFGHMTISGASTSDREYVQISGTTDVFPSADGFTEKRGGIDLAKGTGVTSIYISPGLSIDLDIALADGTLRVFDMNPETGEYIERGAIDGVRHSDTEVFDVTLAHIDDTETALPVQPIDIAQVDDVVVYFDIEQTGANR